MTNGEGIQPNDAVIAESIDKSTVDEVEEDVDESEVKAKPAALPAAMESVAARKTPVSLKLDLSDKQAAFDDNQLVVTLTFAPNKVNVDDKHLMLAIQVAGEVVALQSFKQSTFGTLPEPIQALLAQGRRDWPKQYAEAMTAKQAAQVKGTTPASAKNKGNAKIVIKSKDIKPLPPPASLMGDVPSAIKKSEVQETDPADVPKSSNPNPTLFDVGD